MKTIRKGISVLEQLSRATSPMGVTELATALDIDKAIVHRILKTLEEGKLVQQELLTKRYSLGIGFVQMGGRFLDQLGLPELAHPHLLRLWERCNETVHLCIQSDLQTVLLRVYESRQGVRVSANVGEQAHLHATSTGKVFLAYGSADSLKRAIEAGLPQCQPHTIHTVERLREEIALVRQQGYATDIEESDQNYSAVAMPVIGAKGECLAAVAVAMPVGRMPSTPNAELLSDLKATVNAISLDSRKSLRA
jgi:DNA-binding IclR family transcriptional regulator